MRGKDDAAGFGHFVEFVDEHRALAFQVFDDVPDATFTGDALGRVNLGRNPFTDGSAIRHTYGKIGPLSAGKRRKESWNPSGDGG